MLRVESPPGSRMQHGKCQLRFARFSRFTQLARTKTRLTQGSRRHHDLSDNSFCRAIHACITRRAAEVIPACRSAFHAGVIVSIAHVKSTCNDVSHSSMPPVTLPCSESWPNLRTLVLDIPLFLPSTGFGNLTKLIISRPRCGTDEDIFTLADLLTFLAGCPRL